MGQRLCRVSRNGDGARQTSRVFSVPLSALYAKQGGTADNLFVLDSPFLSGIFLFLRGVYAYTVTAMALIRSVC